MQKTITIPDDKVSLFVDAYSIPFGYSPTLEDGSPNPETQAQFAQRMFIRTIKNQIKTYQANQIFAVADVDVQALPEINIT